MTESPVKRGRGRPVGTTKPPLSKAPVGRPRYAPGAEQKRIVEHLLAVNEKHADIAALLGISEPTFRSRFAAQITDARLRLRVGFLAVVFEKAMGGNASMLKLAMDLTALPEPDAQPYSVPEAKEQAQEKPAKMGKKEQQALDAANPNLGTAMGELMARRSRGERTQ